MPETAGGALPLGRLVVAQDTGAAITGPARGDLFVGSGDEAGLRAGLIRAGIRVVVFGHSHIPFDDSADGLRILNPGSPTDKRRQPFRTLGLLDVGGGRVRSLAIVPLP